MGEKMGFIVAHDIGTSSVRSVLTTVTGQRLAATASPLTVLRPAPNWAEQRPQDWLDGIALNTRTLLAAARVSPREVVALSFASQMQGTLPVDAAGSPIGNALIWLDMRAEPQARRAVGGMISAQGYGLFRLWRWLRLANGAPGLSGRDPVAKMLWLKECAPAVWQRAAKILDVKDYVLAFCTGRFVTSRDCGNTTWLMDTRQGRMQWSDELIARLQLDRSKLPEIARSTETAGVLLPAAAEHFGLRAGTSVYVGSGDLAAMAIGTGAIASYSATVAVGTSAWVTSHVPQRLNHVPTYTASICSAIDDAHLVTAHQECGGSCVQWLRDAVAPHMSFEDLLRIAERAPEGSRKLAFLPWLNGEYAPIDDPFVRGGFVNLSFEHGLPEMVRAVVEGVAYNVAWAFESVENLLGRPVKEIRLGGGAAQSPLWCQTLANVLQRPVWRPEAPEVCVAQGAAFTAAVGLGTLADFSAVEQAASAQRCFSPNPAVAELHQTGTARLRDIYRRNRSLMRRMNAGGANTAVVTTEREPPLVWPVGGTS